MPSARRSTPRSRARHDELVFEVPEAEVTATAQLVKSTMEGAAALEVPLVVDVGHGISWDAAH